MTASVPSKASRVVAWVAVVAICAFIALGVTWYGLSAEVQSRIWRDISERPSGPMVFRFILQPMMAIIAAFHDGVNDAWLAREPYFWTVLGDSRQRASRLKEGVVSTARIILLGIGMDAIYQYKVLGVFYPGEAALVALLLAFIPYLLLRGPITRIARRRIAKPRSSNRHG